MSLRRSEGGLKLSNIDNEVLQDFIVEVSEHTEQIEMDCLAIETDPNNSELINSLFRAFHSIKGLAGFVDQEQIHHLAHHTETMLQGCRTGDTPITKSIVDAILASSDYIKRICGNFALLQEMLFLEDVNQHIARLITGDFIPKLVIPDDEFRHLGDLLVETEKVTQAEVDELLELQRTELGGLKLGQVAVKKGKATAQEVVNLLRKQDKTGEAAPDGSVMRVSSARVDNLVDMLGELMILGAGVEQEAVSRFGSNDRFVHNLTKMSRITKDMQNVAISMRMVSLKATFQRLLRIGRDTVSQLGKSAHIELRGEETEIDRSVAERLMDPLVHLLRNSIAHGIESPSERQAAGKSSEGRVVISAQSSRGYVHIDITDDGKGLHLESIYKKALEMGLVDAGKSYSDQEIGEFIFLPGFSTAQQVDAVSGRGVGLDVVKTEINRIGGKVDVQSTPGQGCKFSLKIPINLAIINGTVVEIGTMRFILPTLHIRHMFKPKEEQWVSVQGLKRMVNLRNEIIPLIPVEKILPGGIDLDDCLLVIIEVDQGVRALPVTTIVDRRDIVVKPLGEEFRGIRHLSGASILGDGKVSLILDAETLLRMEEVN